MWLDISYFLVGEGEVNQPTTTVFLDKKHSTSHERNVPVVHKITHRTSYRTQLSKTSIQLKAGGRIIASQTHSPNTEGDTAKP